MHLTRIAAATLTASIAYFVLGGVFFTIPAMKTEFMKYPAVYRSQDAMKQVMAAGLVGMLLSMLALSVLFAMIHPTGGSWLSGAGFGAWVALFALGSFVLHNYVNLSIGWRLTVAQAIAYSVEWILCGIVIALIYR